MNFDSTMQMVVVERCRKLAVQAAGKLGLDCADDLMEISVRFDNNARRDGKVRGYFCHVADDGLGEITLNTKRIHSVVELENILVHEFGHALVHYLRRGDDREGAHGKTFQYVMRTMGHEGGKSAVGPCSKSPESVYEKK